MCAIFIERNLIFMNKETLIDIGLVEDNQWLDAYVDLINSNLLTAHQAYITQKHHIIPKFYFKDNNIAVDNSESNVVNLSIKDHVLAHYYLCRCTTDKYKGKNYASIQYILRNKQVKQLPELYEFVILLDNIDEYYNEYRELINKTAHTKEACEKQSNSLQKFWVTLDKNNCTWLQARSAKCRDYMANRNVSCTTRQKMSKAAAQRIGKKNPFYGKKHSNATKKTISEKNSKRVIAKTSTGEELYFNSIKEAHTFVERLLNRHIASQQIVKAANDQTIFAGYTWIVLDNGHKQRQLSETGHKKMQEAAVKAHGQCISMQYSNNVTIKFDSIRQAAAYIAENNIDQVSNTNIRRKIKKAAINGTILYDCKWNLL